MSAVNESGREPPMSFAVVLPRSISGAVTPAEPVLPE
jgi:hypothetical protein